MQNNSHSVSNLNYATTIVLKTTRLQQVQVSYTKDASFWISASISLVFLQYLVTPSSFCFQSFHPLIFKSLLLQYFTSAVFFFIFFQPNIVHNVCVTRAFLSMDCVISTFSTLPNALITPSLDVVQLQIPLTYFRLSNLNSLKIHFLSVHFHEIKPG